MQIAAVGRSVVRSVGRSVVRSVGRSVGRSHQFATVDGIFNARRKLVRTCTVKGACDESAVQLRGWRNGIRMQIPLSTPGLNVAVGGGRTVHPMIDFDFDCLAAPSLSSGGRTSIWARHRILTQCNIETGGAEGGCRRRSESHHGNVKPSAGR